MARYPKYFPSFFASHHPSHSIITIHLLWLILCALNLTIRTPSLAQVLAPCDCGFSFYQENMFQNSPLDDDLNGEDIAQTSNLLIICSGPPRHENCLSSHHQIRLKCTNWPHSNLGSSITNCQMLCWLLNFLVTHFPCL